MILNQLNNYPLLSKSSFRNVRKSKRDTQGSNWALLLFGNCLLLQEQLFTYASCIKMGFFFPSLIQVKTNKSAVLSEILKLTSAIDNSGLFQVICLAQRQIHKTYSNKYDGNLDLPKNSRRKVQGTVFYSWLHPGSRLTGIWENPSGLAPHFEFDLSPDDAFPSLGSIPPLPHCPHYFRIFPLSSHSLPLP